MTPLFDTEDLDALVEALGDVDVTLDDVTVKGFFDHTDEEVFPDQEAAPLLGEHLVLKVRTGALPGLGIGVDVEVDLRGTTTTYTVRRMARIRAGAWTALVLDTAAS